MNPLVFIETKRDGGCHTPEELRQFVLACRKGEFRDYQIAAWLMAVYFQGLSPEELRAFTEALAESGHMVRLPEELHAVDKHSTGGVGDKGTLVVVPLVAACGVPVSKLSGRGLDFTGGTLDKLESIPGFRSGFSLEELQELVRTVGCAVAGHSLEIAPAEGLFYALRDVTGTVPSLPLIASSIVSKKLAGGASGFVFDVKCGSGAFMRTREDARNLARLLVDLSRDLGRKAKALVTDMDVPLGRWIGNAAEVLEAVHTLQGRGPKDTEELSLALAGAMLVLAGAASSREEGLRRVEKALRSGEGLEMFRRFVAAQGGTPGVADDPEGVLALAPSRWDLVAPETGWLDRIDARKVGVAMRLLGGGRLHKDDAIHPGVAAEVLVRPGGAVEAGSPVLRLHYDDEARLAEAKDALRDALVIVQEQPPRRSVVLEAVD
ncbi:thymidine phosphorylase [Aminiphilus sp.]|uniref:thymidine phosphorylase n=1 Tax=Aminiphilus sp. TaxID=1872488 RepID=UPI0026139C5A|nr:thymidine phosphorylase [Aminiphilus sp.]